MKNLLFALFCCVAAGTLPSTAFGVASPYVTVQTNVPLAQATGDTINGVLPYFQSHSMIEGTVETLTDAATASSPGANVIPGPDNTWIGIAWDFGEPPQDHLWRLERFDAWIAGGDDRRKGYQADLSVSLTGDINDFSIVPNSKHWDALSQNGQFNHIRYDFPAAFMAGSNADMDRYPVIGFRYLRFNSLGDQIDNVNWQTRLVELDAWVMAIPDPAKVPVIHAIERVSSGEVILSWSAIASRNYGIYFNSNLTENVWSLLGTIAAESDPQRFTNSTSGNQQGFYRVELQPVP